MTWTEEWITLPLITGGPMFAPIALLLALLCFVVAQFKSALGDVDLTLAGLAFLTVAFLLGSLPSIPWRRK